MGKRKRILSSNTNPFEIKDTRKKFLEFPTSSLNSFKSDSDSISKKTEKKKKIDAYKIALECVNNDWRKIKYRCVKNESPSESNSKDPYDVARNTLLFDRKSVRATEDIQQWKILNNIKDFTLDLIVKNVSNDEFMNDIVQDLHLLATRNNLDTAHKFREMLSDEYDIFSYFKKQKMKRDFPRTETVVLLSIICRIYSTDVARHPVVLPAMIYMCNILSANFYQSYSNIIIRLYVCELLKNCISESRKFIPECIRFLKSIFDLALAKNIKSQKFNLIITEKVSFEEIPALQLFSKDKKLTTVSKKVGVIFTAANLTSCFATLYKEYPACKYAFQPILDTLIQLPVHLYPVEMETLIRRLIEFLGRETPPFRHLTQTTKLKSLKMLEPVFECQYESLESYERQLKNPNTQDNKNKVKLNKGRENLKRVKQKIRKEERSLLKEIRKSAKAAAAVKLKEKLTLDAERVKKTAKIYNELAVQEHEFKKMMKKK